jgi:ferric-dicitrate binding protein FerR (iron transport regulator)
VRQILERNPPRVPPGVHEEAVARGSRSLRRRALVRRTLWVLVCGAVLAFTVWAVLVRPWAESPSETTPPLTHW